MIDACVKLIEHPGRLGALEQRQRLRNEIVEIECAPRRLDRVIAFEDRVDETRKGGRAFKRRGGFSLRAQSIETPLFLVKFGLDIGALLCERFGEQAFCFLVVRLIEKDRQISSKAGLKTATRAMGSRLPERASPRPVPLAAGFEKRRDLAPAPRRNSLFDHFVADGRNIAAGTKPQSLVKAGGVVLRPAQASAGALAHRLLDEAFEPLRRTILLHAIKHLGEPRIRARIIQNVAARALQQLRLRRLVGDLEARRRIRLEGKEMQQPFAKGVDGLDLEAARRLDGAREELTRLDPVARARLLRADRHDGVAQRRIIEPRP